MQELFEHQKSGIAFLKEKGKAILADEMGLGKTRQAIEAARNSSEVVLVICPASIKINWEREIQMVHPEDCVYIVESGPEETLPKELPWIVINYDMLGKYKDQLIDLVSEGVITTAVIDEAHYIKGRSTDRAKNTLEIVEKMVRVYLLTGTPVLNRPVELFNMLKAIRHPLGKLRTIFVKRYCGGQRKVIVQDLVTGNRFFVVPEKSYGFKAPKYRKFFFVDESGATHLDELKKFTTDVIIRRVKSEVVDLPEKIISEPEVEMNPEWRRAYDGAWDKYLAWIESHPDSSRNIENVKNAQQLVELIKLKQVCSLAKVDRIVADIENATEQGQKVIVFSQFTETIKTITQHLRTRKIRTVTLTGADDSEDRQAAVDSFQTEPEVKAFVANMKAGGIGINLTAASIVIFADMDWSPEINKQAEDRAHRIGQAGTVNVYYYIIRDTVESEILKILREKKDIIGALVGGSSYQQGAIA